jgi:hypothetical protein
VLISTKSLDNRRNGHIGGINKDQIAFCQLKT